VDINNESEGKTNIYNNLGQETAVSFAVQIISAKPCLKHMCIEFQDILVLLVDLAASHN
jgi:hypothetical protein